MTDVLDPNGPAHYATVQSLLDRLESKGCVSHDRSGAVNVYRADLDRDDLLGRRLQALAEELCGGSWAPLLTYLVRNRKLSAGERSTLRGLIDA